MFLGHGGENVNIVFKPVLTGGFLLETLKKWRRHPVSLVVFSAESGIALPTQFFYP